jgi:cation/acetate symporter
VFVILFKLLVLGALLATIAVGVMARTGRVSEFYAGDAKLHPALNGLAIAASAMPAALLASLAGVLPFGGQDDMAVFSGVLGGVLLIGLVLAAPLWRFAGYTLPDFLADRFQGGDVRTLGIIAVLFCSLPLLVAVLWVAGSVAGQAFGTDQGSAVLVVSAVLLVAALPGGMRSVTITQFVLGAVLIAAVAVAVIVLRATGTVVVSPYDVGISPLPAVLAPGNSTGRLALAITLALGTASLPHLLMRSITAASPQAARYSYAWALLFLAPLYFAPLAFRAGFALLGGGVGTSHLTSGLLAALAGTALLAASLAAAFGLALTLANLLSYDLYYKSLDPTAPQQRRLGAARAGLSLVVAIAAWLATRADLKIVLLATWCFSLAASVILPVLALGLWWKRANGHGAVAGIVAGFALCLYYLLAPRYVPISFYETSSFLSNATPDDQASYLLLQQAYALAAGPAKGAALAAWEAKARALGNWGGVPGACAALFAVPVGFLVTVVVSLFTPRPSADLQGFVAELRGPLKGRE